MLGVAHPGDTIPQAWTTGKAMLLAADGPNKGVTDVYRTRGKLGMVAKWVRGLPERSHGIHIRELMAGGKVAAFTT